MKLVKMIALSVICLLIGSVTVSAFASEGTDILYKILNTESTESVEACDTAILFETLSFSIPSGWEKTAEEELIEGQSFQYRCTDKDGATVFFEGVFADTTQFFGQSVNTYGAIKEKLEKEKADYIIAMFQEIEMIASGDDSLFVCMCLTQDGTLLGFGFESETKSMADVARSEKLMMDINAILHSIKALPDANLMSFDEAIWGEPNPVLNPTPAADRSDAEKDIEVEFFNAITDLRKDDVNTYPIFLRDQLVLSIPEDWIEIDPEDSVCAFTGADETGNRATVVVDAVKKEGITLEALAEDMKRMRARCMITAHGRSFFVGLANDAVIASWLAEDDYVLTVAAYPESVEAMQSEKLTTDLMQILCRLRPVYEDELDQLAAQEALNRNADKGEAVSFQNPEFERMVRRAMRRADKEPVYAAELQAIRNMYIRAGKIAFARGSLIAEDYQPPFVLDLSDLALFPNLRYLSIIGMECTGFEVLTKLSDLCSISLIRNGLTDCGFLNGMKLTDLILDQNSLTDFSPIASLTELKKLSLCETGLDSLDDVSGLDLTHLVASNNPISDLQPIAGMVHLTYLAIDRTNVRCLDALRNINELHTLDISDMPEMISLEPLYELENLQRVYCFSTMIDDADREKLNGILF